MNRKHYILPLTLVLFLAFYCVVFQNVRVLRNDTYYTDYIAYTAPAKVLGPASLEFKGIVSDFLFLKMITSIGEKIGREIELNKNHSKYIYDTSSVITDLDPYFWDAYVFSSMTMAWGFGEYNKANELLLKAREYRKDDYRPPYYIGFNYFYFLKDNSTASQYLMEASRRPGCPFFLKQLAGRLSVYSDKHKTAILFLTEMLKEEKNNANARQLQLRIDTLTILDQLESKVSEFQKAYHRMPASINELVEHGLIKSVPKDPYGGEFYVMENGRVFTTSKMRL